MLSKIITVAATTVGLGIAFAVQAAPVVNWSRDTLINGGFPTLPLTGADTNAPVVGDGVTPDNGSNFSIWAAFPQVTLSEGQTITFSGTITNLGMPATGGVDMGLRFGIFKDDAADGDTDSGGWDGYLTGNSNGAAGRPLFSRNPGSTDYNTNSFISTTGTRAVNVNTGGTSGTPATNAKDPENALYLDGTYNFFISVKRIGATVEVDAGILGTGAVSDYTMEHVAITETNLARVFQTFDRVGIRSLQNAEQVAFSNMDVSVSSPPPVPAPGDFDGDGDVDGADFVAWQTHFPTGANATLAQGDADNDGDVDGADFAVWKDHFPISPSPGATTVPEPSAITLTVVGFGLTYWFKRRTGRHQRVAR